MPAAPGMGVGWVGADSSGSAPCSPAPRRTCVHACCTHVRAMHRGRGKAVRVDMRPPQHKRCFSTGGRAWPARAGRSWPRRNEVATAPAGADIGRRTRARAHGPGHALPANERRHARTQLPKRQKGAAGRGHQTAGAKIRVRRMGTQRGHGRRWPVDARPATAWGSRNNIAEGFFSSCLARAPLRHDSYKGHTVRTPL